MIGVGRVPSFGALGTAAFIGKGDMGEGHDSGASSAVATCSLGKLGSGVNGEAACDVTKCGLDTEA